MFYRVICCPTKSSRVSKFETAFQKVGYSHSKSSFPSNNIREDQHLQPRRGNYILHYFDLLWCEPANHLSFLVWALKLQKYEIQSIVPFWPIFWRWTEIAVDKAHPHVVVGNSDQVLHRTTSPLPCTQKPVLRLATLMSTGCRSGSHDQTRPQQIFQYSELLLSLIRSHFICFALPMTTNQLWWLLMSSPDVLELCVSVLVRPGGSLLVPVIRSMSSAKRTLQIVLPPMEMEVWWSWRLSRMIFSKIMNSICDGRTPAVVWKKFSCLLMICFSRPLGILNKFVPPL